MLVVEVANRPLPLPGAALLLDVPSIRLLCAGVMMIVCWGACVVRHMVDNDMVKHGQQQTTHRRRSSTCRSASCGAERPLPSAVMPRANPAHSAYASRSCSVGVGMCVFKHSPQRMQGT